MHTCTIESFTHFTRLNCILAHLVASRFVDILKSYKFCFEINAVAGKSERIICNPEGGRN